MGITFGGSSKIPQAHRVYKTTLALQEDKSREDLKPSAPVLQGGTENELLLLPPPYRLPPPTDQGGGREAQGTWEAHLLPGGGPNENCPGWPTLSLFPRAVGPQDDEGNERMQYWPFAMSDLYNWKNQSPRFSDNLLGSVMGERILTEAQKLVPGSDGNPLSILRQ